MDDTAPGLTVLKIGGSLVSEKSRPGHLDTALVGVYARLVADLWRYRPGRVALVVGGGAIGHGAVRHLSPGDPFAALELTHATFTVRWQWVRALRAYGVQCYPLQVGAMCAAGDGGPAVASPVPAQLLRTGALPVLSGDCVITEGGKLEVFGSDRVPEVFLHGDPRPDGVRVAVLTDMPGVVADGRTVPFIDPYDAEGCSRHIWPAAAHDTSGAMGGKVAALQALARAGGVCVIARGDAHMSSLRFLTDPYRWWARRVPHTLIAVRGG